MKYDHTKIQWRICQICGGQYPYFPTVDRAWKKKYCTETCRDKAEHEKEMKELNIRRIDND
jgi:hypothetical protein